MLSQVAAHSTVAAHPPEAKSRHFSSQGTMRRYRSPAWRPMVTGLVRIADAGLMVGAILAANHVAPPAPGLDRVHWVAGLVGALLAFLVIGRGETYAIGPLQFPGVQAKRVAPALVAGAVAQGLTLWALQVPAAASGRWALSWLLAALVFMLGLRVALAPHIRGGIRTGWLSRRVAVVGATELGYRIAETIATRRGMADQIVGVFDDGMAPPHPAAAMRVSGRVADLIALSRRERIDAIVIALPSSPPEEIAALRGQLRSLVADVYFAPDIGIGVDETSVVSLGGRPVINILRRPLTDRQMMEKALLDRLTAAFLLLLFSPVLLMIAVAIRLDSRGPILFRQPRMGFNNVPFTVFKFRSMYHEMADLLADRQTSRDDPRVTRVGRPLRKLSLDELPQLLNVLRGEMSLVGPRPHAPNTKAEGYLLEDAARDYADRHRIKPGITGWAQINGARGELKSIQELENRLRYDMHYIGNWSLLLDIRILWLTVVRELISSRAF